MTKVIYKGSDDFRVLGAKDLAKAGVDGFTQKSFPRGVAVEVDADVAEALINEDIFGSFAEAEQSTAEAKTSDESTGDLNIAATGDTVTDSGSAGIKSRAKSSSRP